MSVLVGRGRGKGQGVKGLLSVLVGRGGAARTWYKRKTVPIFFCII